MTKADYWKAHVAKNPAFANEDTTIKIKVGQLRKLMEEAYDKGGAHRIEMMNTVRDIMGRFTHT